MKGKQKKKSPRNNIHPSSFRDPSGFLFWHEGRLLRQVNKIYRTDYDLLMDSGLYKQLIKLQLLIPHEEYFLGRRQKVPQLLPDSDRSSVHLAPRSGYKIIAPEKVQFISYPYEWCFSQMKDAALLTLKIQQTALAYGMSLKDASAYNIQFYKGKPILMDTLSFEKYKEGRPWIAYRQFCRHFLAPLALAAYVDIRLSQLLRIQIDGIPLDFAVKLLPNKTILNSGLLTHLHLHAKANNKFSDSERNKLRQYKKRNLDKAKLIALIDNLYNTVDSLLWKKKDTEWGDYYAKTNYSKLAFQAKKDIVAKFLSETNPATVWDLGANTGEFSRLANARGAFTLSFDYDPLTVEKNYNSVRGRGEQSLLPLLLDLTNPSPALGWAHKERESLVERGPADLIMALALIHHLTIANNLPFDNIAKFFRQLGDYLIIEFVPKDDSQVRRMLTIREDIFTDYNKANFESAFGKYYRIIERKAIPDSKRTLYFMVAADL